VEDSEPARLPRHEIVELQTFLPAEFPKTPGLFEQFLQSIQLCRDPISFELIGKTDEVLVQFAISPDDLGTVRKQLKAYFPLVTFLQSEKTFQSFWSELDGAESVAVDIGLSDEFMRPLAVPAHDPFIGIAGALSHLREGELGLLQVLVAPTRYPWAESIVRAVTDADGDPFFLNDACLRACLKKHDCKRKTSLTLFHVHCISWLK
jgi:hypothetical protein